jgi:hypothetical protein
MRTVRALVLLAFAAPASAQPALAVYPNPFDGTVHDTITVRNDGDVTVTLDSLRFTSSLPGRGIWGWFLHLRGWFVPGVREGWVVCDPHPGTGCAQEFWGEELAPGDSLRIEHPRTYCAMCRERPPVESAGLFDDTLQVFAGGHATPVEAIIVNGMAIPGVEDGPGDNQFELYVTPNPVVSTGSVTVLFGSDQASGAGAVRVAVLDVLGREVALLHAGPLPAGATRLTLHAGALPAGVYVVRVGDQAQVFTIVR